MDDLKKQVRFSKEDRERIKAMPQLSPEAVLYLQLLEEVARKSANLCEDIAQHDQRAIRLTSTSLSDNLVFLGFVEEQERVPNTKQLYFALYVLVDTHDTIVGRQGFLFYAADEEEANDCINALPAEREGDKQYEDVLKLTHGLVLVDGTEVSATIVVGAEIE